MKVSMHTQLSSNVMKDLLDLIQYVGVFSSTDAANQGPDAEVVLHAKSCKKTGHHQYMS